MPTSLNCPNCGAPSGENATACAYCRSRLATVACTSCMGAMFAGSQFCPHCGTKVAAVEAGGEKPLPCPSCGGEMPSERVGSVAMHQCPKCGGQFLSPDAFASICNDHEVRGTLSLAAGGVKPAIVVSMEGKVHYVKCPKCEKVMNRTNFGHTSGIVVDICKGHGVWFDRDELRQVIEFVDRGGLDQSQAAQAAPVKIDPEFFRAAVKSSDNSSLYSFMHALFE